MVADEGMKGREPRYGKVSAGQVVIRKARLRDLWFFYQRATDLSALKEFLHPVPPSFLRHVRYFVSRLWNTGCQQWVILTDDRRVGVIRATRKEDGWEIAINIEQSVRGRGIGRYALIQATCDLRQCGSPIYADIKPQNTASRVVFMLAGYRAYPSDNSPTGVRMYAD